MTTHLASIGTGTLNYQIVLTDPNDHIQKHLSYGEPYEHGMLSHMAQHDKGVFIDVGANIGNHTLYLAARGFTVHAFEPDKTLCDAIERSAYFNSFTNVTVHNVGLGSRDATGTLTQTVLNNVGAQVFTEGEGTVRITTLDSYNLSPSLMKIDVEGMELDVLQGAAETIDTHKPILYVETEEKNYRFLESWWEQNGYVRTARYNSTPTYRLIPKVRR